MFVQGRDCSIVIMTANREIEIPYTEETIRENISLLEEYPCIEGDGKYKAIRLSRRAAGCVVTSATILTAPLLFYLALGDVRSTEYVSETRNVYQHILDLLPMPETRPFGLLQNRGNEKKYYPACRVKSFELRILRDETVKLKLDISSDKAPVAIFAPEIAPVSFGERFNGENVRYWINNMEYKNIYGITLAVKKDNGVKTELWIRRVLERGADIPEQIDELTITALLLRDKYEDRYFGKLRITLRKLILRHDETSIECDDSVIGSLRYFVNSDVTADVFTAGKETLA